MRMRDRDLEIAGRFDGSIGKAVLSFVTDEIIEEHARRPRGPHSMNLQRVLRYMRRASFRATYVVVAVEHWKDYRIAVLTPIASDLSRVFPRVLDEPRFTTDTQAMHAIFLRRLAEMREAAELAKGEETETRRRAR